jgi:hypothetical protein
MHITYRLPIAAIALLLTGCTIFGLDVSGGELQQRPADLAVVYRWREGTLPPPYHYEYSISVQPSGAGEIVMRPDYPSDEVPTWTEAFTLSPAQLDAFYAVLVAQGLFRENWRAEDVPPVGGSSDDVRITAHGRQVEIPSFVVQEQAARADAITAAVRALVPPAIWEKLTTQREEYVAANGG